MKRDAERRRRPREEFDRVRAAQYYPVVPTDEAERKFARALSLGAAAILAAALAVHLCAALLLRGFYGDGAYIFLLIVRHGGELVRSEAPRAMTHIVQQLPTYLALKLGMRDLIGLAMLYSLTMELLPWLFVVACYFVLPKAQKSWFVFPLFTYLAGMLAAAFEPLAEAPAVTAYFWFLLFLIVFRARSLPGQLAVVAAALPALRSHEVMVFLAPILAGACVWRARDAGSRPGRILFAAMALWFALVAATQLWFTIFTDETANRASFIASTLALRFIAAPWGINVPTVLGLLATLVALAVLGLRWRFPSRAGRWIAAGLLCGFAGIALGAVVMTTRRPYFFQPSLQFEARNYAAFLSVPLAGLFFAAMMRSRLRSFWTQTPLVAVLAILAAGQLGWHLAGLQYWASFLDKFGAVLAAHRGPVALAEAEAEGLAPLSWPWTYPALSIDLAPDGKVAAMIVPPPDGSWQPFDPTDPAAVPRSRLFDTSVYRQVLLSEGPRLPPKGLRAQP